MTAVTVRATINAPVDDVFAFVADSRNDPIWAPEVASVELVTGIEPALGAVYRVGQRIGPVVKHLEMEVVVFEQPSRISWTMRGPGFRYRAEITLSPTPDGGTAFEHTNTMTYSLPGAGQLWAIAARKVLTSQCGLLKTHLESGD